MNDDQIRQMVQKQNQKDQYSPGATSFHTHNNVDSPQILYSNLGKSPNQSIAVVNTTGTTPSPFFGTTKGTNYSFTITGVYLISLDTTAGNISVYNSSGTIPTGMIGTVATITKGTTASAMVGSTSLAHTSYVAGASLTARSTSAGNATIFLTYTLI